MAGFMGRLGRQSRTIGLALALVLGTVLLLLVLSVFLPMLRNPLVLIGGAAVELWLVLTWQSRRQRSS